MSWYDSSSLVILPLKLVAIARALSDESFTGWRFEIALFSVEKCSVSRQSSARRKVWSSFCWEKRRTTKSDRVLDEVMEGRVGFLIWIEVGGSPPISLASWLQVSVFRAGLQRAMGMHSSVRYQVCL